MLSRVANCIYWLNRYIERAENYARFMDVNFNLSLEMPPHVSEQWLPLVMSSGDWELFKKHYDSPTKQNVIKFLGFDRFNPSSVYNCISYARENARIVRPELTNEVWEQINQMYFFVKEAYKKELWLQNDLLGFFQDIKKGCYLLYGIIEATTSRTDGWHFGNMGRLIERADKTSRILDVKYHIILPSVEQVGASLDIIQWAALLKSVSAYDMFRKSHGNITPSNIVEFLVLDKYFPRSIFRCVTQLETSLKLISGSNGEGYANKAEKLAGKIRSEMEFSDVADIFQMGLHEYLDQIQIKLNSLSDEVHKAFFLKSQHETPKEDSKSNEEQSLLQNS